MIKLIEDYLNTFKGELRGSDRAVVQDALSDAEDHLTTALEIEMEENPDESLEAAVGKVIRKYGEPEEVAEHYRNVEKYTTPVLARPAGKPRSKGLAGFFSVLGDPVAWASLLYMILAVVTGCIYFTWAVTGVAVSGSMIVLIVGVPLAWLFFLSFRGIAFVEGRIVEALLGVRMPRRAVFVRKGDGWWGSIKGVFSTATTWSSLVYLIMMLPLGIIYFTVSVTLIAVSLAMVADPLLELVFRVPVFDYPEVWWTPVWLMPVVMLAGVFLFVSVLHLARLMGKVHGRIARAMLVH